MYKILFLFVILISSFDYRIAGLNYWDEALIVVGPLYYILATKRICIKRKQLKDMVDFNCIDCNRSIL